MAESTMVSIERNTGKYLTFQLAGEEYGIEIQKVREIIGIMNITALPRTPQFVKGVINLRGKVIPVVDLRLRFALPETVKTEKTCIIVVEIGGDTMPVQIGVIVDAVSDVLNVLEEDIEETPNFGVKLNTDFILCMAKSNGKIKTLLDIDKVLLTQDISFDMP